MIKIRKARDEDFDDIWDIFHRVVKTGDTFALRIFIMFFSSHKLCLARRSLTTLTDFLKSGTRFIKNAITIGYLKILANPIR